MAHFSFTPLLADEIRLFFINSDRMRVGAGLAFIVCELFHVTVSDHSKFVALSYAWNDEMTELLASASETENYWMSIDLYYAPLDYYGFDRRRTDTSHSCEIDVGLNLGAAIRTLHRRDPHLAFWADLICINQSDLVEKRQQVSKMGGIYINCCPVFV